MAREIVQFVLKSHEGLDEALDSEILRARHQREHWLDKPITLFAFFAAISGCMLWYIDVSLESMRVTNKELLIEQREYMQRALDDQRRVTDMQVVALQRINDQIEIIHKESEMRYAIMMKEDRLRDARRNRSEDDDSLYGSSGSDEKGYVDDRPSP